MHYWGPRSPWWLEYGDTLFEPGLQIEAAHPSGSPALYARDSVTIGLDQAHRWAEDIPSLGKDSLGVWLSRWNWNSSIGKERWQEGFVMDMARGSLLAQPWSDDGSLSDLERGQLADFIALLKTRPDCFGNPRPVLGDPWKHEPYGAVCGDGDRAFLVLNNYGWEDRIFQLELNPTWGLEGAEAWDLYRWYPDPAQLRETVGSVGPTARYSLRPFEAVLLEVVPAGVPPSLGRTFENRPIPSAFEEPSRALMARIDPAPDPNLQVPIEEDIGKSGPAEKLPRRSIRVTCQIPATSRGGILAILLEMAANGLARSINNVGRHFAAIAAISGAEQEVIPVLGFWTFDAPWQGWRVPVTASVLARDVEMRIAARLGAEVELLCRAYFLPR
jgi:hypothetical protein